MTSRTGVVGKSCRPFDSIDVLMLAFNLPELPGEVAEFFPGFMDEQSANFGRGGYKPLAENEDLYEDPVEELGIGFQVGTLEELESFGRGKRKTARETKYLIPMQDSTEIDEVEEEFFLEECLEEEGDDDAFLADEGEDGEPVYVIDGQKVAFSELDKKVPDFPEVVESAEHSPTAMPRKFAVGYELHPVEIIYFSERETSKERLYKDSHGKRGRKPWTRKAMRRTDEARFALVEDFFRENSRTSEA